MEAVLVPVLVQLDPPGGSVSFLGIQTLVEQQCSEKSAIEQIWAQHRTVAALGTGYLYSLGLTSN